jgi:GTPase SAR1 family protein
MTEEEADAAAEQRLSYKVVLLGDAAVGKTSLIRQLIHSQLSEE